MSAIFTSLAASGTISTLTELEGPDVASQLTPAAFDVVVFPGGGGSSEATGIGAAGAAAVQAFVAGGGGYYGTCAGAYLAGTATCCDVPTPGYCGGATGCTKSSYALGLVQMGAAEPWDRGHGYVDMMFNEETIAMLQLNASRYSQQNVSILYYQVRGVRAGGGAENGSAVRRRSPMGEPAPACFTASSIRTPRRALSTIAHTRETSPLVQRFYLRFTPSTRSTLRGRFVWVRE